MTFDPAQIENTYVETVSLQLLAGAGRRGQFRLSFFPLFICSVHGYSGGDAASHFGGGFPNFKGPSSSPAAAELEDSGGKK